MYNSYIGRVSKPATKFSTKSYNRVNSSADEQFVAMRRL